MYVCVMCYVKVCIVTTYIHVKKQWFILVVFQGRSCISVGCKHIGMQTFYKNVIVPKLFYKNVGTVFHVHDDV